MRYFLTLNDFETLPSNVISSSANFILLGMNVKKEDKEKLLKWAKVTTESPKQETPKTIEEIMNKVLDK